jgi:hypothetical protein
MLLLGSLALSSPSAQADTFEIRFFYDDQKDVLNFDERSGPPVSVNPDKYISQYDFEDSAAPGEFEYSFFDITGYEMEKKQFSPRPGYFTVELPYYSIAKTLKVKRSGGGDYFLVEDISDLVSCNANNICEFEKGETIDTCLVDCANGKTQYSPETQELLRKNNGTVRDQKTGEVLLKEIFGDSQGNVSQQPADTAAEQPAKGSSIINAIILIVAVIVFIAGVATAYLWWRNRNDY